MNSLDEAREIVRHLEIRKRINPLEFFCPLKLQKAFKNCTSKIKILFGGNRCLSGETLIYDPVLREYRRIDKIRMSFHVEAWDGKRIISY